MPSSDPHAEVSPRDALARLLDGVQTLFREHLALAKVELKDDLRRAGRDVLLGAAGVPPLLVGYLLLMVAFALLLALALPAWIAFGLVAALNLVAGAALTRVYGKKVHQEKIDVSRTGEEPRRLGPRSPTRELGQPVAGATSTPDGEPMTAQRTGPLRH